VTSQYRARGKILQVCQEDGMKIGSYSWLLQLAREAKNHALISEGYFVR